MSDVPAWQLTGLIEVAREQLPDAEIDRILNQFEMPDGRYMPYGTFCGILEQLQERLGGPEAMIEVGRQSIRRLRGHAFQRVARQLLSADSLYRISSSWHGRFAFPFLEQSARRRPDGRLELEFRFRAGYPLSEAFCMGTQGIMETLPLLIGGEELRANATIDGQCFRLYLRVPRSSLLQRGIDRVRTFAAAPLAMRELAVQAEDWRERYEELAQANRRMRDEMQRRIRAEADQRELEDKLLQQHKMEAVGTLASGIAHDFNNILTIMMLNIGRLRMRQAGSVDSELVEIDKAAQRARALTQQLLAFSRQERGQPEVVELNGLVTRMESMLERLMQDTVELRIELHSDGGTTRVDPVQLEQVLVNLVINARDAIAGHGVITICTRDEGADSVVVSVTDTGPGIDPAIQHRLFDPFFTTKPRGKGTGLGLASAHALAEKSDGSLEVNSELGEGATFTLRLPRSGERAGAVPDSAELDVPRGTESILIADDDKALGSGAAKSLRELGYTVELVDRGEQALDLLTRGDPVVDLLVADVMMPGMDGVALVQIAREHGADPAVLYMTGQMDAAELGVEIPAGANVLRKPFTSEVLARRVREALGD